ncbi:porin [Blastopirellula sp. JC732]|uniref:Porin n=1 Tax=Blastopirellula sediminis TaxID=2894196 RepID=A0A9X1MQW1_9BACT|nr:porin [Blastopirellula sediminis]MCC9604868.1 porin [Blastopirellula sediminis]MCC9631833.1 porin [Blastopirellula sediminis]
MTRLSRMTAFVLLWAAALAVPTAVAQTPLPDPLAELHARVAAQEAELQQLRLRLDQQPVYGPIPIAPSYCDDGGELRRLPVVCDVPGSSCCEGAQPPTEHVMKWYVTYDDGFVVRPFDPDENPYEVKFGGWGQFRYVGFARDAETWTDNAGVTRPIRNRNEFEVERARLHLSGYAIDKRLTYYILMDGDTDGADLVDFFYYWWAWEFGEGQKAYFGKRKVAACRQWLLSSRNCRLIDRPMATDFFRPDRSVGVFGETKLGENGFLEVMLGDGYRTQTTDPSSIDSKLAFAATSYWDPFGDYGLSITDYSHTQTPLVRLGHSFVYAPNSGITIGQPIGESDFIRLTDGTRMTEIGALAPGVTLSEFSVYLYAMDFGAKWNGWSFDAEFYMRWIENLKANGPLPVDNLYQHGYFVEGGYFLIPERLDANIRYSYVTGLYGNCDEYGAGVSIYPCDTRHLKISFDVTKVNGSPLNNTSSGILVGDDGILFRSQLQAEF